MKRFHQKVVLITGASSGIGLELARAFFREGAHLILLARRVERLRALQTELERGEQNVLPIQADVSEDLSMDRALTQGLEKFGRLDVVVANAGFGVVGRIERLTVDDYKRQFETNVFGVIRTVKPALSELRKAKGRIGIVGSVNGFLTLAGNSPYAMSKFAVRSFCDALRAEVHADGISVTHIAPGFVKSEIQKVDNRGVFHPDARESVPDWIKMDTDKAARKIVNALYFRCNERVITVHGYLLVWLSRLFPWLIRFLQRHSVLRARRPLKSER